MKIRNIALMFIASCIVSTISAGTIDIKNEYRLPIIINADNFNLRELNTGEQDTLSYTPQNLKIKIKFANITSLGIQQELEKIKKAEKTNRNLFAKITILDTDTPENLKYNTQIQSQPNKPITPPSLELMLFNESMTTEQYLMSIMQGKNPSYNLEDDIKNLRQLKGHAEEVLQNLNRLTMNIPGYPTTTTTTNDAKANYIKAGAHPYYDLVTDITNIVYSNLAFRNFPKFIQDTKSKIKLRAQQLANQIANNRWVIQ